MSTPKRGDKVRVTYEAEYVGDFADGWHKVGRDRWHPLVPGDATIEVIEPVDDPSKDPVGTVRKDGYLDTVVVRAAISSGEYPWAAITETTSRTHDEVFGWEVIGAVPGTPAAVFERAIDDLMAEVPEP